MEPREQEQNNPPQRLCSEIKLFDLCDLDSCSYKRGRYCSNEEVVSRFEKISEEEFSPPQRYIDEELDDDDAEEDDYDEYECMDDEENGWE